MTTFTTGTRITADWLNSVDAVLTSTLTSVKSYGAIGNGIVDDTNAIQDTIDANPGKTIYFPAGTYRITSTLIITSDRTKLKGDGFNSIIQYAASTGDAIRVYSLDTTINGYISLCCITDLLITKTVVGSSGAGIRLIQGNSTTINNIYCSNFPEGISILGGQTLFLETVYIFASASMNDLSAVQDSALLQILEAPCDAGLYQPCYTVQITNIVVSSNQRTQCAVLVANVDGLQWSGGYLQAAKQALIRFRGQRNGGYVGGVTISNVFMDAIVGLCEKNVDIPSDGFASFFVYNVLLNNCWFGGAGVAAIYVRETVSNISIVGGTISNPLGSGVDFSGNAAYNGGLTLSGVIFQTTGTAGGATSSVRVSHASNLAVTGCQFYGHAGTNAALRLDGSISSATITGNAFTVTGTDFESPGTITKLIKSGNVSSRGASSTVMGTTLGNVNSTDTSTLDWYLEGTFTPTITFGGNAVGITYTTNTGKYTRVGNVVHFELYIVLSALGSSTGNLNIIGLPLTVGASTNPPCSVWLATVAVGVGANHIQAIAQAGSTAIRVDEINSGTGATATLTNSSLTATSTIIISGTYIV